MLSRSVGISRTAGEDRETRAHARVAGSSGRRGGAWGGAILVVVALVLLVAFAILNRGAVVEPRLDMVFAAVDRPSLLAVLVLTSVVSAAGALMVSSALREFRQRLDAGDRKLGQPAQPPPLAGRGPATARVAAAH